MNTLFYKFSKLIKFIPVNVLSGITNQKIIYPFYHIISDKDVIHVKHLYKIRNIKEFENDLDFLLKNYKPIDITTLIKIIVNKTKSNKPAFLLSFDDGLREYYDVVAPILIKKGIPSINFLNSGFIDNKDLFFRYKLSVILEKLKNSNLSKAVRKNIELWFEQNKLKLDEQFSSLYSITYENKHLFDELSIHLEIDFQEYMMKYQPYMTSEQINSLVKQGFPFGAHSVDHPQYSVLNTDQQISQTETSINDVITKFGLNYKLFSFPFTDYCVSKSFFDTIFNEKRPVADITFGCAGIKKDSVDRNLQRIPIEIEQLTAKEVIYGEYLYYFFKAFLNKNIIKRI